MRKALSIFLALVFVGLSSAQDAELTNYKNGIDVTWGGTKGVDYQEEYVFHDKLINDTKVVFLRGSTSISMFHNATNLAAYGGSSYRGRFQIGPRGVDGDAPIAISGVAVTTSGNLFTYAGHGRSSQNVLRFISGTGGAAALNPAQRYYVINATANTFQLSTNGSSPITISSDGTANFVYDDEGVIRYEIDRLWGKDRMWSNSSSAGLRKPEYTAPFTLASQEYETGVPVVGTTGGRPGYAQTAKGSFYWRGLTETVGTGTEEYHILMVADDDWWLNNSNDSCASDGKYYVLVVNPITPAMTVRATGEGKFYTTPAWTYWVPKIHAQTTYFEKASGTGTVTFELKNIYGGNISYRINGGSTVDVGAATVTIDGADFPTGTNTLEYWYTATPTVIRTRTVVRSPAFPSAGETHGNLLWPSAWWDQVASRVTRQPYKATWNDRIKSKLWEIYPKWDAVKRTGKKLAVSNALPDAQENAQAPWQAMFAKNYGFTAINSGASKSYAAYAKEMLMESPINQHPVGIETDSWASAPLPCPDLVYRGYLDAKMARDAAIAYDILISGFRSDQVTGGITPVEDYFLRDMLATWVHWCAIYHGGFCHPSDGGMWPWSRDVGAILIGAVMPKYSTSYYGTSGFDGTTTTVYSWAPFQTYNYTWKTLFLVSGYTANTGLYPTGPVMDGAPLVNDPAGTLVPPGVLDHVAMWGDKLDYLPGLMAPWFEAYANMVKLYDPAASHPALETFFTEAASGTLYGGKAVSGSEPYGPWFLAFVGVYNPAFPTYSAIGNAASQAAPYTTTKFPNGNPGSASKQMEGNVLGQVYYDDTYYGGADVTIPTVTITGPTSSPTYSTTTGILTLSGDASDNVSVTQVLWSNDRGGGGTATGTTSWTIPLIALEGANVVTVRSQDSSGNLSTPDTITVTYTPPVDTPPGSSTTTHANPRNRRLFGR